MNITRYLVASSTVVLSLLVASPALAHSSVPKDGLLHLGSVVRLSDDDGDKDRENKKAGVTVTGTVSAISGSTITLGGKNGATYTVIASTTATTISKRNYTVALGDIAVGDRLVVKGTLAGSVITATKIRDTSLAKRAFLSAIGAAGAGIVTSINGSTFTLSSFGAHGTTTVSTNASTTYKVNGVATTSSARSVGSRAIIFGTTDSGGITASLVSILNTGFGFFKHFFR